jgi:hypothetical protein
MPARKKADAGDDPNKLIRQKAGTYRTADNRFEVRQAALGWFLVDSTTTDELGQELVRGPYPTLKAITDELPEARRTTIKPLPRPKAAKPAKSATRGGGSRARPKAPSPEPKREPTWLDRLPDAEASAARRLIRALSLEGIDDAEDLVRAARKAKEPIVATRVLEHRLERLLDELPAADRDAGRRLLQRASELMTITGTTLFDPVPGWAVVEVEPGGEPDGRRVIAKPRPRKR